MLCIHRTVSDRDPEPQGEDIAASLEWLGTPRNRCKRPVCALVTRFAACLISAQMIRYNMPIYEMPDCSVSCSCLFAFCLRAGASLVRRMEADRFRGQYVSTSCGCYRRKRKLPPLAMGCGESLCSVADRRARRYRPWHGLCPAARWRRASRSR